MNGSTSFHDVTQTYIWNVMTFKIFTKVFYWRSYQMYKIFLIYYYLDTLKEELSYSCVCFEENKEKMYSTKISIKAQSSNLGK